VLPLPKNRRLSADIDNLHALCRLLETQKLISRSIAGELNGAQHEEGRVQKPNEPASSGAFGIHFFLLKTSVLISFLADYF
jgi:hypothetical protein